MVVPCSIVVAYADNTARDVPVLSENIYLIDK
jgi:hypothetical protein